MAPVNPYSGGDAAGHHLHLDEGYRHRHNYAHPHHMPPQGFDAAEDVDYSSPTEKLDSDLQIAWNGAMDKDYFVTSTTYYNVQVLMLYWEPKVDDLNVRDEVDQLAAVFQDTYGFGVTKQHIVKDEKKVAQTQINRIVANWVDDHDGLKTLLIVYFAGHGRPGEPGEIILSGFYENPDDIRKQLNRVVWNHTEMILQGAQADVFQIFDCCYAGTVGAPQTIAHRGGNAKVCEYLAACAEDQLTARPGPESFTSALIWALKESSHRPMTTVQLVDKIRAAPDFRKFRPKQRPVLRTRGPSSGHEKLVLFPLKFNAIDRTLSNISIASDAPTAKFNSGQQIVTLKFVFEASPKPEDITNLGKDMNFVVRKHDLNVSRILWAGIKPRHAVFSKAAGRFQEKLVRIRERDKQTSAETSEPEAAAARMISDIQEDVTAQADKLNELESEFSQHVQEFGSHTESRRLEQREAD